MGTFLSVLKNDIRIISKDIKALLLLLLMPIIVILIFARALAPMLEKSAFVDPFDMAVVDKEKSIWTGLLSTQLKSLGLVDDIFWTEEEEARELIKNNEAAAAIIIPENLTDSVDHWDPEKGKVLGSSTLYLESRLIKNIAIVGATAVSSGLAALNTINDYEKEAGFDDQFIYKDINHANEDFIQYILARKEIFVESRQDKPDINPVEFYAASMLAVFIMFSSIPCVKLIAEERRMGILSRIMATPSRTWHTIGSKLIVSLIISCAQFSIIGVFIAIAAKTEFNNQYSSIFLIFLCTALASAAFSLLIGSVASTSSATDLIANLSILLMAVIGGSIYPLSALPEICRAISPITINRWSSEGFIMALSGERADIVYNSCFMLLLLALGYFTAALLILGFRRRRITA